MREAVKRRLAAVQTQHSRRDWMTKAEHDQIFDDMLLNGFTPVKEPVGDLKASDYNAIIEGILDYKRFIREGKYHVEASHRV